MIAELVGLPVKTTLPQNVRAAGQRRHPVGLPVKTTLPQNYNKDVKRKRGVGLPVKTTLPQNRTYCEITATKLDYQSKRHCPKTSCSRRGTNHPLDYQSKRHCPKTILSIRASSARWITSQNDTAPKRQPLALAALQVGLPVKTTLPQNKNRPTCLRVVLDYQSKRHCPKTLE